MVDMQLHVFEDYNTLSDACADHICQVVNNKPDSVLILPTGNSPLGTFERLVEIYQAGMISFRNTILFELDEYILQPGQSEPILFDWLVDVFISKVDFKPENIYAFQANCTDPNLECERMRKALTKHGGADLALLGLGPNGHLAMNEPGSAFSATTRVVDLTPETILSNSAYWGNEDLVPRQGMTIGMAEIQCADAVYLLACGEKKKDIFQKLMQSPPDPNLPASVMHQIDNAHILVEQSLVED